MEIDYRNLLKKYIWHILDEEGMTFVDSAGAYKDAGYAHSFAEFTEEQLAELRTLKLEVDTEYDAAQRAPFTP